MNFAVAKPMLLQAVVSVGSGRSLDEAWLYDAMRRRIELVACLDLFVHLLERLPVDNGRMIVL